MTRSSFAGIRGCANVQFKRGADGVFKLLEVNPRFPGTLPLTTAAGIDMPKLMVDELMGRIDDVRERDLNAIRLQR